MLERRDAQGAADLAALAGVRFLPGDAAQAEAQAITNAAANGYTITTSCATRGDQGRYSSSVFAAMMRSLR